jgi:hypothetical protein
MTGSHEVDGSIPFSSTKDNQGVICATNGGSSPFLGLWQLDFLTEGPERQNPDPIFFKILFSLMNLVESGD